MDRDSLRVVSKQDLVTEIKVRKRMPSFKVLNQADARPWHFQELLKSKDCWRLVVFAGNMKDVYNPHPIYQSSSGRHHGHLLL
jgi:phenol 2-monooxygenase